MSEVGMDTVPCEQTGHTYNDDVPVMSKVVKCKSRSRK